MERLDEVLAVLACTAHTAEPDQQGLGPVRMFLDCIAKALSLKAVRVFTAHPAAVRFIEAFVVDEHPVEFSMEDAPFDLVRGEDLIVTLLNAHETNAMIGPSEPCYAAGFDLAGIRRLVIFERDVPPETPPGNLELQCTVASSLLRQLLREDELATEAACLEALASIRELDRDTNAIMWEMLERLKSYLGADGASLIRAAAIDGGKMHFSKLYVHGARRMDTQFEATEGLAHYCISRKAALLILSVSRNGTTEIARGFAFPCDGPLEMSQAQSVTLRAVRAPKTTDDEQSLMYWPLITDGSISAAIKIGHFRRHSAFDLQQLRQLAVFSRAMNVLLNYMDTLETVRAQTEKLSQAEQIKDYAATLFFYREVALGIFHQATNHLDSIDAATLLAQALAESPSRGADELRKKLSEIKESVGSAKLLLKNAQRRGRRLQPVGESFPLVEGVMRRIVQYARRSVLGQGSAAPQIETSLTDEDYSVYADPDLLYEALVNVVNNALWAIRESKPAGKRRLFIAVRPVDDDRTVRIVVEDTGIGIPPEHFPRLFEGFFTTRTDGTGLGLYFARLIVELFGGSIGIERSFPGAGTTVVLKLPIEDEAK